MMCSILRDHYSSAEVTSSNRNSSIAMSTSGSSSKNLINGKPPPKPLRPPKFGMNGLGCGIGTGTFWINVFWFRPHLVVQAAVVFPLLAMKAGLVMGSHPVTEKSYT